MANEIQFSAALLVQKGFAVVNKSANSTKDMAGSQVVQLTQSIATSSWQALTLGNLSGTPAKLLIENLDSANYVELATDNAGANKTDKITAHDFVLRSPVGTIYAKANTAAVVIQVTGCDA